MLEVNHIRCRYQHQVVLDELSLAVRSNEIVCLLGASGCGKTTLLKAIAGLLPISGGDIWLDGECIDNRHDPVPPERRHIGMIFQDYALFPHLTVADNIRFGLSNLERWKQAAKITDLLALVNLEGLGHRYPHELSGGQQQRVAIARSLAREPKLLLLDEPFSNIDSQIRMKLIDEIRTLLKRQGITAIFVTHSKEEAFAFADRLALFRSGRIEQLGDAEQLYRRPHSRFVAEFLGGVNYVPAKVLDHNSVRTELGVVISTESHGAALGADMMLMLRPQQFILEASLSGGWPIISQQFLGHYCKVIIDCNGQRLETHISDPIATRFAKAIVVDHPIVLFPILADELA